MKLPVTRADLIHLYTAHHSVRREEIADLNPTKIAFARDKKTYQLSPFQNISENATHSINIGRHPIKWINTLSDNSLLHAVGLNEFTLKEPCNKRIHFIEKQLLSLTPLFEKEIDFISELTSAICWIDSQSIGSAGFYEVPHCTFFSDSAMFSIPPTVVLNQEHAAYAIFENLYHEALHHQMHAISTVTNGYLIEEFKIIPHISLSWRDRTFTLLEAIHALHIYSSVTNFRLKYYTQHPITLLEHAYLDSLRMWKDLTTALTPFLNLLKTPWQDLILQWKYK